MIIVVIELRWKSYIPHLYLFLSTFSTTFLIIVFIELRWEVQPSAFLSYTKQGQANPYFFHVFFILFPFLYTSLVPYGGSAVGFYISIPQISGEAPWLRVRSYTSSNRYACRCKLEGGLGFKIVSEFKQALMAKQA